MTEPHEEIRQPLLTAADRCDRCGAAARVSVTFETSLGTLNELLFCGHHYHENELVLKDHNVVGIVDDRESLTTPVSPL